MRKKAAVKQVADNAIEPKSKPELKPAKQKPNGPFNYKCTRGEDVLYRQLDVDGVVRWKKAGWDLTSAKGGD
jgi:hypothetical protein